MHSWADGQPLSFLSPPAASNGFSDQCMSVFRERASCPCPAFISWLSRVSRPGTCDSLKSWTCPFLNLHFHPGCRILAGSVHLWPRVHYSAELCLESQGPRNSRKLTHPFLLVGSVEGRKAWGRHGDAGLGENQIISCTFLSFHFLSAKGLRNKGWGGGRMEGIWFCFSKVISGLFRTHRNSI